MTISKSIRLILISLTASVSLLATGCGGGGGGSGSGDDGFPTPRLPADAATFDAGNAGDIANTAVGFVGTLDTLAQLKGETSPSIPQVTRMVIDRTLRRTRNSALVAARSESLSEDLCNPGDAMAVFEESGNTVSGSITFDGCNIDGSGIVINGSFAFIASANGATMDYSFQAGGALTVAAAGETITIEMNLQESGNDGTGDFSTSVSFSLSGIPDSGFLVTTAQPWVGNALNPLALEVTSGQLIVHGGNDTRIRITVTTINTAAVDLDEGSGYMPHSTILFTP